MTKERSNSNVDEERPCRKRNPVAVTSVAVDLRQAQDNKRQRDRKINPHGQAIQAFDSTLEGGQEQNNSLSTFERAWFEKAANPLPFLAALQKLARHGDPWKAPS